MRALIIVAGLALALPLASCGPNAKVVDNDANQVNPCLNPDGTTNTTACPNRDKVQNNIQNREEEGNKATN